MSKKGQFELRKMIFWTIAIVIITIVIFAFVMILNDYENKLMKVSPRLKAELISLRFLNNPDCFAYQDEGRVYPGVIDLSKFNKETLDDCYKSGSKKKFNFQLSLDGKELETDKWRFGPEISPLFKKVLVRKEGELKPAMLKIRVQEKI